MTAHIGDDAVLYALGLLSDGERAAVDAHIRVCAACARILGQAEDDVTAIASLQEAHAPPPELDARMLRTFAPAGAPPHWRTWMAVAAAVLLALLPSLYFAGENRAMHDTVAMQNEAMQRIAMSPHRTVSFAGADARVMYAPDGSWYCVFVKGDAAPMHVMWPHDNTVTDLGTTGVSGDGAMLYLPKSHRMDRLQLVRDGAVVGSATLVF